MVVHACCPQVVPHGAPQGRRYDHSQPALIERNSIWALLKCVPSERYELTEGAQHINRIQSNHLTLYHIPISSPTWEQAHAVGPTKISSSFSVGFDSSAHRAWHGKHVDY